MCRLCWFKQPESGTYRIISRGLWKPSKGYEKKFTLALAWLEFRSEIKPFLGIFSNLERITTMLQKHSNSLLRGKLVVWIFWAHPGRFSPSEQCTCQIKVFIFLSRRMIIVYRFHAIIYHPRLPNTTWLEKTRLYMINACPWYKITFKSKHAYHCRNVFDWLCH